MWIEAGELKGVHRWGEALGREVGRIVERYDVGRKGVQGVQGCQLRWRRGRETGETSLMVRGIDPSRECVKMP